MKEDEEKFLKVKEVLQSHEISWKDMCNAFVTGFDISTTSGPLCEEPMLGAAFFIENVELVQTPKSPSKTGDDHESEDEQEEEKVSQVETK